MWSQKWPQNSLLVSCNQTNAMAIIIKQIKEPTQSNVLTWVIPAV